MWDYNIFITNAIRINIFLNIVMHMFWDVVHLFLYRSFVFRGFLRIYIFRKFNCKFNVDIDQKTFIEYLIQIKFCWNEFFSWYDNQFLRKIKLYLIFPFIFLHSDFWNIRFDLWYKHSVTILWCDRCRMRCFLSLSLHQKLKLIT